MIVNYIGYFDVSFDVLDIGRNEIENWYRERSKIYLYSNHVFTNLLIEIEVGKFFGF